MNRRFVNLVLGDYNTRIHSLFRLDVAKHLFYPSTAQAEAANAKQQETNNNGGSGGGGDKPRKPPRFKWPKPLRIKWLSPLPEPSIRFSQFPPAEEGDRLKLGLAPYYDDAFMLLHFSSSSEGSSILHATQGGRAVIYDADKHAISATVPLFDRGMGRGPIAFSVPGADGEKESLYVMRSAISSPVRDHFSSPLNNKDEEGRCSGDFVVLDLNQQPYKWKHLPRLPFVVDKDPFIFKPEPPPFHIRSSAVVDGGRTIVVSSDERRKGNYGTYCFDTTTRQWRHAGDWALPFDGRAEYVPELETWIGLCSTSPHHLCATDLSAAMDAAGRAPALQHVWDDLTPPPYEVSEVVLNRRYPHYVLRRSTDWAPWEHSLVNLGSGRFCTLKVFGIRRSEWIWFEDEDRWPGEEVFAVLTGVEVVRCNDGEEEGLRMVKHKSKRCPVGDLSHWLF